MRLHERAREFATYPSLPLHEFPTGFRFALALVHVVGEEGDFRQRTVKRVVHEFVRWGSTP